ncbi:MAG: flagellar basal body P-ring formation protein FlgA [Herminiimonas sp.]|nr:flagellar basal body P-ring formation protein FlgA [Herminiimonas sp.]
MKNPLHAVVILVTLLCCAVPVQAVPATAAEGAARQDPALLRQAVEQFLQRQSGGLPGTVTIEVGQVDARLNLPACMQPEPFIAHGSRAWGKTAVGIRCTAPATWTIYVTANVHVMAEYLAAATPLVQGQTIGTNDIARMRGDLTMLPAGVITDAALAIGRTTMSSVQLGAPLRQDTLRAQAAVQMGQTIRLLSAGPGFSVSTEGRAMNNAVEGQTVQAKTAGGQVISGIARAGGILEVAH